jgi:hypothetical protein
MGCYPRCPCNYFLRRVYVTQPSQARGYINTALEAVGYNIDALSTWLDGITKGGPFTHPLGDWQSPR